MSLVCTQENRTLTASISGELDHHAARQIMGQLSQKIDAALPRLLTVDLSALSFTDSSGIAVLLRAHRNMERLGGRMVVIHTPPQAEKVFRAAGLPRLITFQ